MILYANAQSRGYTYIRSCAPNFGKRISIIRRGIIDIDTIFNKTLRKYLKLPFYRYPVLRD